MSDSLQPHGLYSPWNSPGQNTGVGFQALLQGIFPTQGSNPGLQNFRWILYRLSHQGSPGLWDHKQSDPTEWQAHASCFHILSFLSSGLTFLPEFPQGSSAHIKGCHADDCDKLVYWYQFSWVQSVSHVQLFATPWTQHTRLPCPSPTPRAYSNSSPSSWWCHATILSSGIPFSSCLQTFPASGSFPTSQFFTSGGQNIGVSASTSVLPMNIQDWFPLGRTGWISLQFKRLSRVFSNTTVQKHQFCHAQLSL